MVPHAGASQSVRFCLSRKIRSVGARHVRIDAGLRTGVAERPAVCLGQAGACDEFDGRRSRYDRDQGARTVAGEDRAHPRAGDAAPTRNRAHGASRGGQIVGLVGLRDGRVVGARTKSASGPFCPPRIVSSSAFIVRPFRITTAARPADRPPGARLGARFPMITGRRWKAPSGPLEKRLSMWCTISVAVVRKRVPFRRTGHVLPSRFENRAIGGAELVVRALPFEPQE